MRNRRIAAYGTLVAAIVGFYFYQPQRINFSPERLEGPNPPVDPDSAKLFSKGTKVALIQAHPDDSEFYLAPLLLRLARSGAEIHQLVMTDGDKSFYFWAKQDKTLRKVREAEQQAAASRYAKELIFLHRPDGRLGGQPDNAEQVKAFIQRVHPDYVLAFDPEYWPRISHSDHLAAGRAALEAIDSDPDGVQWLLLYNTSAPNFIPDVTNTVDKGQDMIDIHKSQFSGEKLARIRNMILNNWYEAGQRAGGGYGVALRAVKVK
ncbi:MAG: hypothetical protein QOJ65_2333 [Fimbriimonadaceae bacterium]|nr:hypothetical protein [Fimbriimonadaceae bacterium]